METFVLPIILIIVIAVLVWMLRTKNKEIRILKFRHGDPGNKLHTSMRSLVTEVIGLTGEMKKIITHFKEQQ